MHHILEEQFCELLRRILNELLEHALHRVQGVPEACELCLVRFRVLAALQGSEHASQPAQDHETRALRVVRVVVSRVGRCGVIRRTASLISFLCFLIVSLPDVLLFVHDARQEREGRAASTETLCLNGAHEITRHLSSRGLRRDGGRISFARDLAAEVPLGLHGKREHAFQRLEATLVRLYGDFYLFLIAKFCAFMYLPGGERIQPGDELLLFERLVFGLCEGFQRFHNRVRRGDNVLRDALHEKSSVLSVHGVHLAGEFHESRVVREPRQLPVHLARQDFDSKIPDVRHGFNGDAELFRERRHRLERGILLRGIVLERHNDVLELLAVGLEFRVALLQGVRASSRHHITVTLLLLACARRIPAAAQPLDFGFQLVKFLASLLESPGLAVSILAYILEVAHSIPVLFLRILELAQDVAVLPEQRFCHRAFPCAHASGDGVALAPEMLKGLALLIQRGAALFALCLSTIAHELLELVFCADHPEKALDTPAHGFACDLSYVVRETVQRRLDLLLGRPFHHEHLLVCPLEILLDLREKIGKIIYVRHCFLKDRSLALFFL